MVPGRPSVVGCPRTLRPVTYYSKLPAVLDLDVCLILDPMLATGGSAAAAVEILKTAGARRITFLGLIAAWITKSRGRRD